MTLHFLYKPIWFVSSSADAQLGCFHLLVRVNNTAMSIAMQVCAESLFSVLLGTYLGVKLLGHMGKILVLKA